VTTAAEDVAARILNTVHSERLRPGDWLGTEAMLADRFNVSRVTIRHAVSALAARGLIDVRVGAGGGLRVAASDPSRLTDAFSIQMRLMGLTRDELFEAMLAIEPVTASLAAERASSDQIIHLRDLVERSLGVLDDSVGFTNLAVEFHQAVGEASRNRALCASLAALRSAQVEHLGPPTTRPIAERVARTHAEIVDAIASGEPAPAGERMRAHLLQARGPTGSRYPP
jgi:GntR family transcriptional repressor for pyruvate dehydrogenase complex